MVSADNLNLDVLEQVFAHLASGNDLTSVALVSRSFLAGVIPRLYETLFFRLKQAKRYPSLIAPFAAILNHPDLAIHVRNIDIQALPLLKSPISQLHPKFLRDCSEALGKCTNLTTFSCPCPVLPPFLVSLQQKTRLHNLRINARLTADQTEKLITISGLQNITLDHSSWNVVDSLPKWIDVNRNTLTSLTIYGAADLNETIFESALSMLPQLLSLHVIGCPRLDHTAVLRCVAYTPLLESLSFTTFVNQSSRPLTVPHPRLPNLRHLSLDSRPTLVTTPTPLNSTSLLSRLLSDILAPSSPPLCSLSIRLADRQLGIPELWLDNMLATFGGTLTKISFGNCAVSVDSIRNICLRCIGLQTLEVPVSPKEIRPLTLALTKSSSLTTLVDNSDPHATHSPKIALSQDNIKFMMRSVSELRIVICDGRIWTGHDSGSSAHGLRVSLEKLPISPSEHWFVPRDRD